MTVRASSLPMIQRCRASWLESKKQPGMTSAESVLGTTIHKLAEAGPAASKEVIDGILLASGLDDDAKAKALELYHALPILPPGARREEHHVIRVGEHEIVTATLDALHIGRDKATVWDYKTGLGYVPAPPENPQMWAYAVAAAVESDYAVPVEVIIPQPAKGRDGIPYLFTLDDIDRLQQGVRELVAEAQAPYPNYTPGHHCLRCNGRHGCPALIAEMKPMAALEEMDLTEYVGALTEPDLAKLAIRAAQLAKLAESAKDAVNAELSRRGVVEVQMEGGMSYGASQRKQETIDVWAAWPILQARLGNELPKAVKITKSGIEAAAGSKKAAKGILADLEVAGAVTTSYSTTYGVKKTRKEIEENE